MKRIILSLIVMIAVAANAQKATLVGKVAKMQPTDTLLVFAPMVNNESYDTLMADKKGRFTSSYDIHEYGEAYLSVKHGNSEPETLCCMLLQPGKTVNVDVTMLPSVSVKFSGEDAAMSEYANQYFHVINSTALQADSIVVKCTSYDAAKEYIEAEVGKMEATVNKIGNKEFVAMAKNTLNDLRDNTIWEYVVAGEKAGVTMKNDKGFQKLVNAIDVNDTLKAFDIYRYLDWYYAAHPGLYTPMSAAGAKIKYLAEYTSNQDVRNKVANIYIANIVFLASWGMDTASEEHKDMYEQYLKVSTDTTYVSFIKQNLEKMQKMAPGEEAIDFVLNDANGTELHFTDLLGKGNVTYIDFWATWCGPCKREIPFLAKLAEEYKGKNLRVVSISIDARRKDWIAKINEDKPEWEQYIVPDIQNCPGLSGYNINSIPRFMLFDKNGKLFKSSAPRPSDVEIKVLLDNLGV